MLFRQIFDPRLAQYAYLVGCQKTGEALIIDPQRDVDRYFELAAEEGMRIVAAAETHIHADFLSGARELAESHGLRVYLSGEGGPDWQYAWPRRSGDVGHGPVDAWILSDGDRFRIGNIEIQAVHTPGHTPEHLSYLVIDRGSGADEPMGLASGDFVFVGDLGRPDLLESAAGHAGAMEPSARRLFHSVTDFLDLPDYLQIWPGHGAGSSCGKALGAVPGSTVGYEKRHNPSILAAADGEDAFVAAILEGQPEPPLYFGRMKRLNKEGPPVLGELPRPRRLSAAELGALAGRDDVALLDTRRDRQAFMAGHLPGALYAPLNRSFPTIAGSYVEEGTPVYLVAEDEEIEEVVRELIRIGLDEVAGYVTPEDLAGLADLHGTIEVIDFARAEELRRGGAQVLDVRRRAEFEEAAISGALNIAHTRLLERKHEAPASQTLLVHCLSGARAASASALLHRHGFEVAYVDDHFGRAESVLQAAHGQVLEARREEAREASEVGDPPEPGLDTETGGS